MVEGLTNNINKVLIEKGIKQTWLAEKLSKRFTIVNSTLAIAVSQPLNCFSI